VKLKGIVVTVLLVFVLASVAFLIAREARRGGAARTSQPAAAEDADRIVAYYFYAPPRCYSCVAIQAYTREAVETGFADKMKAGRLQWRTVDVSQPGNEHFIADFGLYTKSVVLVETRGGKTVRWKNLEKVWELLGDKGAFLDYVSGEVRSFMEGASG